MAPGEATRDEDPPVLGAAYPARRDEQSEVRLPVQELDPRGGEVMEPFSQTQDAAHPVKVTWQGYGEGVEYATVEEAVRRVRGFYEDNPPGWIEQTLRAGTPLRTVGAFYQMEVK